MPYLDPVKRGKTWVLPKKGGGYAGGAHVRHFKSKAAANRYKKFNLAREHGWKPTGKAKKK